MYPSSIYYMKLLQMFNEGALEIFYCGTFSSFKQKSHKKSLSPEAVREA